MLQSLVENIQSAQRSQHGALACAASFALVFFGLGDLVAAVLRGVRATGCQNELMILIALALAYSIGMTHAGERTRDTSKTRVVAQSKVLPSRCQSKRPVQNTARLLSQVPRATNPVSNMSSDEEKGGVNKKSPSTKTDQLTKFDADVLNQAKREGISPNAQAYSLVIGACVRLNNIDVALEVLNQMLKNGVHYHSGSMSSNTIVKFFRIVMENLDELRMREIGIQLLDVIQAHGMVPTTTIQNQIICAWKSKPPDSVLRAFMKLRQQGIVLSSTAYRCIMAANERTKPEFTLELYDEMVENGVKLDRVSFNAVLCACSIRGMTSKALELFESMPAHGLAPNGKTYGALIRACTAGNLVREAVDLFDSMRSAGIEPNRFAFHDVIYCCVKVKKLGKALSLYREMITAGVPPCKNTCVYLGNACQKRGWTETADQIALDAVGYRAEAASLELPPGLEEAL